MQKIISVLRALSLPITYLSALWLRTILKKGISNSEDNAFMKLGVYPLWDHYYEPLINPKKHLFKPLSDERMLKGIDFNVSEQLGLLDLFAYNEELIRYPLEKTSDGRFYFNNGSFNSGDAEYLYNIIRHFKPKRIVEIGSGNSTLIAHDAIIKNAEEGAPLCKHVCIEPYETTLFKHIEVETLQQRVETFDPVYFKQLDAGDILFIDSTHIIRPQGDVLFEYLEILPILNSGVLVHIHDVFTPRDYPESWIYNHCFWNEQYLLEAFLSFNSSFKIIGALNFLKHNYRENLAAKCPIFCHQEAREPGSFWMVKL